MSLYIYIYIKWSHSITQVHFASECPCVKMQMCPECSKAFTRKDSLQRHIKSIYGYTVDNSKGQIVLKNEDCTSERLKDQEFYPILREDQDGYIVIALPKE